MEHKPGDTIRLLKTTLTRGTYMGEEGIGYSFIGPSDTPTEGDFSAATRGHLQGWDEIVEATINKTCTLDYTKGGGYALFGPDAKMGIDSPQAAQEDGYLTIDD